MDGSVPVAPVDGEIADVTDEGNNSDEEDFPLRPEEVEDLNRHYIPEETLLDVTHGVTLAPG